MMRHFIHDSNVFRTPLPDAFQDDFKPCISFCQCSVGTLNRDVLQTGNEGRCTVEVRIPHNSIMCIFNSSEMESLMNLFSLLYPLKTYEIGCTFHKYLTIEFRGKVYGSYKSRSRNSSIIFADLRGERRPARINYFANISIKVDDTPSQVNLVSLSWFKTHPQKQVW